MYPSVQRVKNKNKCVLEHSFMLIGNYKKI